MQRSHNASAPRGVHFIKPWSPLVGRPVVRPAHSVHDPSYTGGTLRGSSTYSARARIAAVTPVPHEQTRGAEMSTPACLKAALNSSSPLYLKQASEEDVSCRQPCHMDSVLSSRARLHCGDVRMTLPHTHAERATALRKILGRGIGPPGHILEDAWKWHILATWNVARRQARPRLRLSSHEPA